MIVERQIEDIKLQVGTTRIKCTTWIEKGRRFFNTPYYPALINEIKAMRGAKYHGYDPVNPRKLWSVDVCGRNDFQLTFLRGENPYARYNTDLVPYHLEPRFNKSFNRLTDPLGHQPLGIAHILQRRQCIIAGEMGTTKTFMCMTALEVLSGQFLAKHGSSPEIWYVAPRSALRAVKRDFWIWGTAIDPKFMTYEEVVKRMKNWETGTKPPCMVIFDESSKVKTPTSQRSQAAMAVADGARAEWGDDAVIVLMTGTPAPKSPSDWWSQCEIACPGFIREGDIHKFNRRLGIIIMKENYTGAGSYPSLVTWRDNEFKCDKCGRFREDSIHHNEVAGLVGDDPEAAHDFVPSKNEIAYLYERMKGLVITFFKKDCLDLPDKNYRVVQIKPSSSVLRAAGLITAGAKTTIEGLTRLRELSDGFQYEKVKDGKQTCALCQGSCQSKEYEEIPHTCPNCKGADSEVCPQHLPERKETLVTCTHCKGTGEEDRIVRKVNEVATPKEQVLIDLLDEYEDVGRVVIYAGFTAAVDRCCRICQKQGWHVIRIDEGKELIMNDKGQQLPIQDYLAMFQDQKEEYPRVAFVAHPGSAGMGLTLTASPMIFYFSNDFNGESRVQSEDRIHRPGMDVNLGATIIDVIHLPSDQKVLTNLKAKRNLELMSLGELNEALKSGGGHGGEAF